MPRSKRSPKKRIFPLQKVLEYHRNGMSFNQIGKLIKYNPVTVSANLKKAGAVHEKTETEPLAVEGLVPIEKEVVGLIPDIPTTVAGTISEPEPLPNPKPKPPTKPWLQTENPWVPDIFKLRSKHQGFVPRWTDPNLLEKREGEGMQIAKAEDWGEKTKQGDGAYKRKGMILMEMPEEIAESKRAYLKHKTDLQDPEVLQRSMVEKGRQISLQAHVDMGLHKED